MTENDKEQKIFVSFLGTSDYKLCTYAFGGTCDSADEVKFVQTATAKAFPCDRYLIFCTKGAKETHWKGLEYEFKTHDLPAPTAIDVPDGASEDKLWEIFGILCDAIPENADVVFDITHSFRFLPMLMAVLVSYLKETKGVELERCVYGAWEARDKEKNVAPVFDMTPFFVLNDWTRAVALFEKAGDASEIDRLVKAQRGAFFRRKSAPQGERNFFINLGDAVRQASGLTKEIAACRLRSIVAAQNVAENFRRLEDAEAGIERGALAPLKPAYRKLKNEFVRYVSGDLKNGLRAARWCAEHGLIQQGCTILQETVVSLVLDEWKRDETRKKILDGKKEDQKKRELVSAVLQHAGDNTWNAEKTGVSETDALTLVKGYEDLSGFMRNLAGIRNDVNHAGTAGNPTDAETLSRNLSDFCDEICGFFKLDASA